MILDFVLISSFLCAIARGYIKGFSHMFVSLFAFVVAIVLTFSLNNWVGDMVLESRFGERMQLSIAESINEKFKNQKDTIIENSPYIASLFELSSDEDNIIDLALISDKIAKKTVKSLISVFLIIFSIFIFKLIVRIIKKLCVTAASLPVIGIIDRLFGGVCGIVIGVLILMSVFVLVMFIQFVPELEFIRNQYDNSIIVMLLNDFIF